MYIDIITVGQKSPVELQNMIDAYLRRLPPHIHVTWQYVKLLSSKDDESEKVLKAIRKNSRVILLDETGQQFSSEGLAQRLFSDAQNTTIIIGGAFGVNQGVKNAASTVWSLSKLVFPHQLVRLILAEQLYRAHSIHTGHPYHHS